jgi:hypothetical protein
MSSASSAPVTSTEDVLDQPARAQFEAFLDEHRRELSDSLDGLTEEQARRSLVPSLTTLLGLVKHATFVEKVWFDEAVTGRSRAEIGPLPLRWVYLHVLRELAQHCGHADILREQILRDDAGQGSA